MTKQELVTIYKALHQVSHLRGAKFAYGVSRNISLLKPEMDALDKAMEKTEEFKKLEEDFEPTRVAIAEKHAEKDKDGKPVKKLMDFNGQQIEIYDVKDNDASNKEAEEAMKLMNPEVYQARRKQMADYNVILQEESKIAFFPFMIKLTEVPNDISVEQMKNISPVISQD